MARFPSLPLFVDAYLADTGHLTDAEHGRYCSADDNVAVDRGNWPMMTSGWRSVSPSVRASAVNSDR